MIEKPAVVFSEPTPESDFVLQVERGMKWLDEKKPGWVELVPLEALDVAIPFYCVLGHVFREEAKDTGHMSGYDYGIELRGAELGISGSLCERELDELGFRVPDRLWNAGDVSPVEAYDELTSTWIEAIERRRLPGNSGNSSLDDRLMAYLLRTQSEQITQRLEEAPFQKSCYEKEREIDEWLHAGIRIMFIMDPKSRTKNELGP